MADIDLTVVHVYAGLSEAETWCGAEPGVFVVHEHRVREAAVRDMVYKLDPPFCADCLAAIRSGNDEDHDPDVRTVREALAAVEVREEWRERERRALES